MLFKFARLLFTNYLVVLTIGSGAILGFVLPYAMSNTRFKKEYIIGKYVGYFYILLGVLMFITARIF